MVSNLIREVCMKRLTLMAVPVIAVMALFFVVPGIAEAQGEGTVSATVIGEGTFITVKESGAGEVLSLYRIEGDRIVLLDTVVNTSSRSDRNVKFPDRYLHHLDVQNR